MCAQLYCDIHTNAKRCYLQQSSPARDLGRTNKNNPANDCKEMRHKIQRLKIVYQEPSRWKNTDKSDDQRSESRGEAWLF